MTITLTSQNNPPQGGAQAARPRTASARGSSSPRGRTCWPPPTRPGGRALERYCAALQRARGVEVDRAAAGERSQLGSGRACSASGESAGPAPDGPLSVYLHDVADPGNVGTILRAALRSAPGSVVLGPRLRGPVQPEGGAGAHGSDLRPARRAGCGRGSRELPGTRSRSSRTRGAPLRDLLTWSAADPVRRRRARRPAGGDRRRLRPDGPRSRSRRDSLNVAMTATLASTR